MHCALRYTAGVMQGTGGDIIKMALARLDAVLATLASRKGSVYGDPPRVLFVMHDEVIFEVSEEYLRLSKI